MESAERIAPAEPTEPAAIAPTVAVIYVYFPHASRAAGMKPKLQCDGQHMADLANGRFVVLNAPAGFHNFEFKGQKAECKSVPAGLGRREF